MKKWAIGLAFLSLVPAISQAQQNWPPAPNELYGQLFIDVQMARIFPDNKTFVDCIAKMDPGTIISEYENADKSTLDLKQFVLERFKLPANPPAFNYVQQEKDLSAHINNLWSVLGRESTGPYDPLGSLLEIPYPYLVPGGRFREIYYWDTYFTMLGLRENRETETIQQMVDNFTDAINKYGHIPNGFRTYYLSRSQPPFFSLMVEMLAEMKDESVYVKYLPAMEREYAYWMEGAKDLKPGQANKRVARLKDGTYLNRYWDELDIPRTESYADDVATVDKAVNSFQQTHNFESDAIKNRAIDSLKKALYRHLRSAAFSGWDFSNRWFSDGENLSSIETTDIIPVDLNALMFKLEAVIMKARKISGATKLDEGLFKRADFNAYFWNSKMNFYTDYHFAKNKKQSLISLAGMFPFCFGLEDYKAQKIKASKAAEVLKAKLLKPGGLISVEKNTGQQWDAPNGWAPLQWMSVVGLERCGQEDLAKEIANRWMKINETVYQRTGKMMEKYNVEDISLEAGGGEYPGQDGFGWTNGVYLAMKKKFATVK